MCFCQPSRHLALQARACFLSLVQGNKLLKKKNVKQEEEPIGKQDNTTDTLASANTQSKGSHKDALTNSTQETPCEKGVSTSRQQGHSKKLEETSMAAGKARGNKKAAKEASGAAHSQKAASSEADFGGPSVSSSTTSSTTSSSSQNPAPKRKPKLWQNLLLKGCQSKRRLRSRATRCQRRMLTP